MKEDWVTIGEFYDLNEAYLVRSRIEAEDIPTLLQNEQVTGFGELLFGRLGAQLQVPSDQVERALEVLRDVGSQDESEPPQDA
jgi:hypothetical protein